MHCSIFFSFKNICVQSCDIILISVDIHLFLFFFVVFFLFFSGVTSHYINRLCVLSGPQLQILVRILHNAANQNLDLTDKNSYNDKCFTCFAALTKDHFRHLLTFCVSIPIRASVRHALKKHFITLLCKIRRGSIR